MGAGCCLAAAVPATAWAQSGEPLQISPPSAPNASDPSDAEERRRKRAGASTPSQAGAGAGTRYGNPSGSGAGASGYRSTNSKAKPAAKGVGKRTAVRAAPVSVLARPARKGSGVEPPPRPGAYAFPLPDAPSTLLRRPRPVEIDPYAPLGIRSGGFVLFPSVDLLAGYETNPRRAVGGRGSPALVVAPELLVRSDWSRHALDADLRGSYTEYTDVPSLRRPFFDGRVTGRLDVTRNIRADAEVHGAVATDYPNSPDIPAGYSRLPLRSSIGTSVGVAHRFNRFEIAFRGGYDRVTYGDTPLVNGAIVSGHDRDYQQYSAQLRASYELTPGVKPFAEMVTDQRDRDLSVDAFGLRRDSWGVTGSVGSTIELTRTLTGEASVGYLVRHYKDGSLPELQGVVANAALIWAATGLTTVKLTATSTADETTVPGVAGILRRDAALQIDHAFRRWLIATVKFGYGYDTFVGLSRHDQRYFASAGATYKLSRELALKGELRHEWLRSNTTGVDYQSTTALAGIRLQR
jgi:hypothetical protein